jgi:hypothetical protein
VLFLQAAIFAIASNGVALHWAACIVAAVVLLIGKLHDSRTAGRTGLRAANRHNCHDPAFWHDDDDFLLNDEVAISAPLRIELNKSGWNIDDRDVGRHGCANCDVEIDARHTWDIGPSQTRSAEYGYAVSLLNVTSAARSDPAPTAQQKDTHGSRAIVIRGRTQIAGH